LQDVQDVFDRVAEHYDAQRVRSDGRLKALRGAATVAADFFVTAQHQHGDSGRALRGGAPFGSHAQTL